MISILLLLVTAGFVQAGDSHLLQYDLKHSPSSSVDYQEAGEHDLYRMLPVKMKLPEPDLDKNSAWYWVLSNKKATEDQVEEESEDLYRRRLFAAQKVVHIEASDWPDDYRGDFLRSIAPAALMSAVDHQIFPSVALSQAVLESGWGRSTLALRYNNIFGIKGYNASNRVRTTTFEKVNGRRVPRRVTFRIFKDWSQSIYYHGDLLATDYRYAHARTAADWKTYVDLISGKYASEPRYAKKLGTIIEKHTLDRWDALFLGHWAQEAQGPNRENNNPSHQNGSLVRVEQ